MTEKNPIDIAAAYYNAMNEKDITEIASYLHPDVRFLSPVYDIKGKDEALKILSGFLNFFISLKIRAKFGNQTQAMLAYELQCPEPIGLYRAAALLTINDSLITNIELYFDTGVMKK